MRPRARAAATLALQRVALCVLLLASVAGCSLDPAPTDHPTSPTWDDVAPLVADHCLPCHGPGGAGQLRLDSYERARDVAGWIAWAVEERVMPPFGAVDDGDCGPPEGWPEAPTLSDAEVATFVDWADAGAPAGEDGAPRTDDALAAAPFDARVEGTPVGVSGGGADRFVCTLLDPALDDDVWLREIQVLPGAAEVVHHVLVFAARPEDAAVLDAADASGTLDCVGGDPAPSGLRMLAMWAPGAHPMRLPDGAGMQLSAGSRLVLQLHYHPVGSEVEDRTDVGLRWVRSPPPRIAGVHLLGNAPEPPVLQSGPDDPPAGPAFLIPPGASDHPETMVLPLSAPDGGFDLLGLAPHMHYVGAAMEVALRRPGEGERCLVRVPAWDFEGQRWYSYVGASLPDQQAGDELVLRCTYDNTLNNERLREALMDEGLTEPRFVGLGPTSLDEMCAVLVGLVRDAPG